MGKLCAPGAMGMLPKGQAQGSKRGGSESRLGTFTYKDCSRPQAIASLVCYSAVQCRLVQVASTSHKVFHCTLLYGVSTQEV